MKRIASVGFSAFVLGTTLVLSTAYAQAPADPQAPGIREGIVEAVTDVARQPWVRALGLQPISDINYEETGTFDAQLHKSLQGRLPLVTITTNSLFKSNTVPVRMGNWLKRIQSTGGTVGQCQQQQMSVGAIVLALFFEFLPHINSWLTYRPVSNYNAVLYTTPDGSVMRIAFLKRGGRLSCDPGFTASQWAG